MIMKLTLIISNKIKIIIMIITNIVIPMKQWPKMTVSKLTKTKNCNDNKNDKNDDNINLGHNNDANNKIWY